MAEFSFFGSEEDRNAIMQDILATGMYTFIGNRSCSEPKPFLFKKVDQALLDNIKVNKMLFISGPFSKSPLVMEETVGGEYDGTYSVDEMQGGPLLILSLPAVLCEDGFIELIPGDLSYLKFYFDTDGEAVSPSDEIKAHYKSLTKLIKKYLVRFKIEDTEWIGSDALNLLKTGKAKILSNGKMLSLKDLQT